MLNRFARSGSRGPVVNRVGTIVTAGSFRLGSYSRVRTFNRDYQTPSPEPDGRASVTGRPPGNYAMIARQYEVFTMSIRRFRNNEKLFELYSDSVQINKNLTDDLFTLPASIKILPPAR